MNIYTARRIGAILVVLSLAGLAFVILTAGGLTPLTAYAYYATLAVHAAGLILLGAEKEKEK